MSASQISQKSFNSAVTPCIAVKDNYSALSNKICSCINNPLFISKRVHPSLIYLSLFPLTVLGECHWCRNVQIDLDGIFRIAACHFFRANASKVKEGFSCHVFFFALKLSMPSSIVCKSELMFLESLVNWRF